MYQQRIVIIGAGIVGLATAYTLLKQGMRNVIVLEQATVDHQRSTSHGLSRLLRFEYGEDRFYSEMVRHSLRRWHELGHQSQHKLYTPTEVLSLGNEIDNCTKASYYHLRDMGLPIQRLSRDACKQLFPQFNIQAYDMYTYNKEAAILYASNCLLTLKEHILSMGGIIHETCRVKTILHDNPHIPLRIRTTDNNEIQAERVVSAVGSWVHYLLADLQLPIRITRQYLLYFANLSPTLFGLHTFPAFLTDDIYGFPIHSTCAGCGPNWLKVASHKFGNTIDPDQIPQIDERVVKQVAEKTYQLLPQLREARLIHVDACMYDVSPDENFILDYHPDDPRIVFAAGLTGHGFKFGPLLGEILSSLVRNTPPPVPIERFRLNRLMQASYKQHISVA